jgi:hypothetical protein
MQRRKLRKHDEQRGELERHDEQNNGGDEWPTVYK